MLSLLPTVYLLLTHNKSRWHKMYQWEVPSGEGEGIKCLKASKSSGITYIMEAGSMNCISGRYTVGKEENNNSPPRTQSTKMPIDFIKGTSEGKAVDKHS